MLTLDEHAGVEIIPGIPHMTPAPTSLGMARAACADQGGKTSSGTAPVGHFAAPQGHPIGVKPVPPWSLSRRR